MQKEGDFRLKRNSFSNDNSLFHAVICLFKGSKRLAFNSTWFLNGADGYLKLRRSMQHKYFERTDRIFGYGNDLWLQSNFNASNTFGTMKICSRQGLRVNYRGIVGISFRFSFT